LTPVDEPCNRFASLETEFRRHDLRAKIRSLQSLPDVIACMPVPAARPDRLALGADELLDRKDQPPTWTKRLLGGDDDRSSDPKKTRVSADTITSKASSLQPAKYAVNSPLTSSSYWQGGVDLRSVSLAAVTRNWRAPALLQGLILEPRLPSRDSRATLGGRDRAEAHALL
jgi:hypothetical protein